MAKTTKNSFNIDLDSLLMSDFLNDDERLCETSEQDSWKQPKKLKTDSPQSENETTPKTNNKKKVKKCKKNQDVSKFFENVGTGFTKSMEIKKTYLTQFSRTISTIYQGRITEMLKKHEMESENLKRDVANNIKNTFGKFENELEGLKQHESKMVKIFEQQIKVIQRMYKVHEQWIEQLTEIHSNFIKKFEQVRNKQKSETLDLTKSINEDICNLQKQILNDFKNEELQTMKKYFNSFYF